MALAVIGVSVCLFRLHSVESTRPVARSRSMPYGAFLSARRRCTGRCQSTGGRKGFTRNVAYRAIPVLCSTMCAPYLECIVGLGLSRIPGPWSRPTFGRGPSRLSSPPHSQIQSHPSCSHSFPSVGSTFAFWHEDGEESGDACSPMSGLWMQSKHARLALSMDRVTFSELNSGFAASILVWCKESSGAPSEVTCNRTLLVIILSGQCPHLIYRPSSSPNPDAAGWCQPQCPLTGARIGSGDAS
jgi:hypothetical protein